MGDSCLTQILSPWALLCAPKKNEGLEVKKPAHSHGGHGHAHGKKEEDSHVHDGGCDHPELDPEALFEKLNSMDLHHDMKICDILEHLATRRAGMRTAQLTIAHSVAGNGWRDWVAKISNNVKDAITDSVVDVSDPFSNFNWKLYPKCEFGHAMRDANFFLQEGYYFFSASSFPVVARPVVQSRYDWDKFAQKDTTVFRVTQLDTELTRFRHKLAERFLSPSVEKIMLVTSVESAITSVWFSQIWEEGDVLLLFEGEDHWTRQAATLLTSRHKVTVVCLEMNLPCKHASILQKLGKYLEHTRPRLAHIPHVVSASGFIYPVQEMTALLHSRDVPVCINGAVAIGQFPVSLMSISPDYYVGTHHHWLHSLPVSFLYVALQPRISPENNSYFFGESMQREFSYCGLLDFTPWISANIAQGFIKRTGGGLDKQYRYIYNLARKAADILAGKLVSTLYSTITDTWAAMPCVKLPHTEGASEEDASKMMTVLTIEHGVTIQISRLEVEDDRVLLNHAKPAKNWREETSLTSHPSAESDAALITTVKETSLFALVCVQIYHDESDFQVLALALSAVLEKFRAQKLGHSTSPHDELNRRTSQEPATPPHGPVVRIHVAESATTATAAVATTTSTVATTTITATTTLPTATTTATTPDITPPPTTDTTATTTTTSNIDNDANSAHTSSGLPQEGVVASEETPSSQDSANSYSSSLPSTDQEIVLPDAVSSSSVDEKHTTEPETSSSSSSSSPSSAVSDEKTTVSETLSSSSTAASSSSLSTPNSLLQTDSNGAPYSPTASPLHVPPNSAGAEVYVFHERDPKKKAISDEDAQALMVLSHAKCRQPLLEGLESVAGSPPFPNFKAVGRVSFGSAMKKLFYIDDSDAGVFMNCGSFGAAPRCVIEGRHALDEFIQTKPGVFHQHHLNALVHYASELLAKEVGADPERLVLCDNCNAATSIVMKNQAWQAGDVLFVFDCDYECTLLGAERLWEEFGVVVEKCFLELPLTDSEILACVEKKLRELQEKGVKPRLANFCHITSRTAYTFPAKQLVELFHRFDIPVAVDGAHAAGQIALNLKDIGADYYMGTMHKWMYTIQGVAFLYLHDSKKPLSPLVVPKLLGQGLTREFCAASIPQKDLTNWVSAIYAMQFVEECCGGWAEVRRYTHRMAEEAQAVLCRDLNTDVFQAADVHYANMPLVRLPATEGASLASAKLLMTKLLQHGITAFVIRLAKKDAPPFLYVRLSMQIYHDSEDIARLSTRLKELSGQGIFAGFGFASHAVRSLVARPIRQLSSAASFSSNQPSLASQSSFVGSSTTEPVSESETPSPNGLP